MLANISVFLDITPMLCSIFAGVWEEFPASKLRVVYIVQYSLISNTVQCFGEFKVQLIFIKVIFLSELQVIIFSVLSEAYGTVLYRSEVFVGLS